MTRINRMLGVGTAALAAAALAGVGGAAAASGSAAGATPSTADRAVADGDLLATINGNLYLIAPDGSRKRRITTTGGISDAQFSPDGRRIAFARARSGSTDLYTMSADGSGVVRLTNTPTVSENNPTWSPDARRLAFSTPGSRGGISIMTARPGARPTVVKANYDEDGLYHRYADPKWSPRGGWLAVAYERASDGGCDPSFLQRITPTGSDLGASAFGADPDVHPAGTWIAGADSDECGSPWIVKLDVRTGTSSAVTEQYGSGSKSSPVWSPLGTRIAFHLRTWTDGGSASALAVVKADGSGAKIIVPATSGSTIVPRDWRAR